MLRKLAVLSVALIAVAGLGFAADDEDKSETNKLMEQINKKNNDLRKVTRTAAEYKKSASTIPKLAEELIEKAKEAKKIKEPAEKAKKPFADYEKLMDEMITATQELSKTAEKKGSTQAQAKDAFFDLQQDLHRLPRHLQEGRLSRHSSRVRKQGRWIERNELYRRISDGWNSFHSTHSPRLFMHDFGSALTALDRQEQDDRGHRERPG